MQPAASHPDVISRPIFNYWVSYTFLKFVHMTRLMRLMVSLNRFVSVSVVKCLYNHIDEVDMVSTILPMRCESVSVV